MDYRSDIKAYIALEQKILDQLDVDAINKCLNLLDETRLKKRRIYICGNGGSAATASHYQNDFNKGVSEYIDVPFRFHCLNDNVATLMAIANDIGYEEVFRFQLRGNLEQDDVLMAISGSGNSKNILNAAEYAKQQGNKVIGITGYGGGKLKELCDISLHVPVMSMQVTEDVHMIFDHMMMSVLYRRLCGKEHLRCCDADKK